MTDDSTIEEEKPKEKKAPPSFVLNSENFEEWARQGPTQPPKHRRRKAKYDKKIGDAVCAKLRTGQTLRSIAMEMGIDRAAIVEWTYFNHEFAVQYARDLQAGIDALGESARDDALVDIKPEDVPLARHRFDVLRWYVGKRSPRKWGDKIQVDQQISGNVQIDILITQQLLTPANLEKLTEAQIEAWQVAIASIPQLMAPAQQVGQVIEGEFKEVKETKK
jgi:hypothetical protein